MEYYSIYRVALVVPYICCPRPATHLHSTTTLSASFYKTFSQANWARQKVLWKWTKELEFFWNTKQVAPSKDLVHMGTSALFFWKKIKNSTFDFTFFKQNLGYTLCGPYIFIKKFVKTLFCFRLHESEYDYIFSEICLFCVAQKTTYF
jgi:hypothetical protein